MTPRTILFMHQAFPGQFGALAQSLVRDGHKVIALAMNPQAQIAGVILVKYSPVRAQDMDGPFLRRDFDAKLVRAESAYKAMMALKKSGVNPDVIYAHPGWGEALFVKNVWPDARLVVYAEWFYNLHGQEVNFDPESSALSEDEELRLSFKNTAFLHALSEADAAITPTEWQKSRFPAWAQPKIQVIHDGLNVEEITDTKPRTLALSAQGLKLHIGMPIVTYCARHLEPVRGFHCFMRSLPAILQARPDAHVIVMGQDAGVNNSGYGKGNTEGTTWRKTMEKELAGNLDFSRVHFLGTVERKLYLAMLRLSACHVYMTTPFILSWSFLEAATMGLPIIASDTAPVREFSDLHGLQYVDFSDTAVLSQAVLKQLSAPQGANATSMSPEIRERLSVSLTLPKIKDVLLTGSRAVDAGLAVEPVVLIEDEEPQKKPATRTRTRK